MTAAHRAAGLVTLALVWNASTTAAQPVASQTAFRAWRPVFSVGVGRAGAEALGVVRGETRTVGLGTTTPSPFTLFETDSTLGGAVRAELGVLVPVGRGIAAEVIASGARPTLSTTIRRDAEGAPATTASERLDEYMLGLRVTYDVPWRKWGRRAQPYVAAGGAYLRQLHQDRVLVESGQAWMAGAGVRWWLRGAGARRQRPLGLTGEVGWQWRVDGVTFAAGARNAPTFSVRAFLGL